MGQSRWTMAANAAKWTLAGRLHARQLAMDVIRPRFVREEYCTRGDRLAGGQARA